MIRVLHISAAGITTGAGKATILTHECLLKRNDIESKILFFKEENYSNEFVYYYSKKSIFNKIKRYLFTFLDKIYLFRYRYKTNDIFSPGLFGVSITNLDLVKWADVIHIHWANHGFINIVELKKINKKIIWTIRDMWAFTGGCHVNYQCEKFKSECGKCPILRSKNHTDLSNKVLKNKITHLRNSKINWIGISSWIKNNANNSSVLNGKNIDVIYSGIQTSIFEIRDRKFSRQKLGIKYENEIILIGASNLDEKHKGLDFIINTLNNIKKDIIVMTFGQINNFDEKINKKVIQLGYIKNQDLLIDVYNSSNIFLSPSLVEAFGKTVCEAQSCGIPAICFSETGPQDIIEHKKTGYLSKYLDYNDLLLGVKYCLENNFSKQYIRNRTIKKFDINVSCDKYYNVYKNSILNK